ncbi:DUF3014 domain-containing protein [Teredinibacter purpureus]|uniref:DUF3014 domain-containing protein n=1 Tax=Teredinibacter purpureus TaxID=2731756 RepID=UPI000695B9AB|nr:DUF3014 domain-containing protein [Teredinibacter purpureus]
MRDDTRDLGDGNLDGPPEAIHSKRSSTTFVIVLIVVALLAAGVYLLSNRSSAPIIPVVAPTTPIPTPVSTPAPTATPAPDTDLLQPTAQPAPTAEPLPTLDNSDEPLRTTLLETQGLTSLVALLTPDDIIRKFVRAVFNLNQGKVVPQYRPLNGPTSAFKAQAIGRMAEIPSPENSNETIQTALFRNPPQNQQRYSVYVSLAEQLNLSAITQLYRLYYPLLQRAYEELGEGPAEFHTLVLGALRSFSATPHIEREPELILIRAQYQFLDPTLEALPNTQKLILRMGIENRESLQKTLTMLEKSLSSLTL